MFQEKRDRQKLLKLEKQIKKLKAKNKKLEEELDEMYEDKLSEAREKRMSLDLSNLAGTPIDEVQHYLRRMGYDLVPSMQYEQQRQEEQERVYRQGMSVTTSTANDSWGNEYITIPNVTFERPSS